MRRRFTWLSLLLVAALPACRAEFALEAALLRIQVSKQLSAGQRTRLANHLPGIFGIPEVCPIFEESVQSGGYLPTEQITTGETSRTLVCERHRISLLPASRATFWRFRNGPPVLEVAEGAAMAEVPAGEFVLSTGEQTFTVRSATKAVFLLSRQRDRTDLRCRGGDTEIAYSGPAEGVSLTSEGCRMRLPLKNTDEQATFLSGGSFWIVDAQVPESIRAVPPALASLDAPPPWPFLRRPILRRPPTGPVTWSLYNAEKCGLFQVDPTTQKESAAEPAVAITSEFGTIPAAFVSRTIFLRCEYDGMPIFSELSAPPQAPPPAPPSIPTPPPPRAPGSAPGGK